MLYINNTRRLLSAITTANILLTRTTLASAMSTSTTSSPAALIFLHGLGDTPAGWSSLEYQLPSLRPNLSKLTYVFPHAPTIPISINGGMTMPGWFDLYDWPIGVGSKDDETGISRAVAIVEKSVATLEKEKGITRDRIVVGGFSQGGAIALAAAYHLNGSQGAAYAGCVSLSGWVTMVNQLDKTSDEAKGRTKLFWGHGEYDDKVLFEQQKFGVDKLTMEGGVKDIRVGRYPVGHGGHPEEINAFADFLDDLLFGGSSSESKES